MAIYIAFFVRCTECGHVNLPARKVSDGVEKVLTGEFSSCRKCDKEFSKIIVPMRPSVKEVLDNLAKVSEKVELVDYKGIHQYAEGIV